MIILPSKAKIPHVYALSAEGRKWQFIRPLEIIPRELSHQAVEKNGVPGKMK